MQALKERSNVQHSFGELAMPTNCVRTVLAASILTGWTLGAMAESGSPQTGATSQTPTLTTTRIKSLAEQPGSDVLQEIVVTAQYRAESLQHVPMSITAITNQTLEVRDVKNIADYATTIPNLSYGIGTMGLSYGFAGAHGLTIRGISGSDTTGFYIDDTPVPDSIDPHIVGIDRIEVLRGPQGALYGARSMGGTVRLITQQPDTHSFSATTHVGISDTDHTVTPNTLEDGSVNVPLIQDYLALRAEGYYEYDAGYFTRTSIEPPGTPLLDAAVQAFSPIPFSASNVGSSDERGGSLELLWQVNDALSVTSRVLYQRTTYNGLPLGDVYYDPSGPAPILKPTSFDQERLFNIPELSTDVWSLSSLNIKYRTDFGELTSSTSYFRLDIDEIENQSEFLYLTLLAPVGGTPVPATIPAETRFHRYVEEVRFVSELRGPVQFVAGAYYADTFGNFDPPNGAPDIVPGLNAASGYTLGSNLVFEQFNHNQITEPALYGDVSWNATEKLKLTGGLRLYKITTDNTSYQNGLVTGLIPIVGPPTSVSARGVNPKYDVDYQFTPDHMAYALASKGFRPGGFEVQVPGAPALGCAANLAQFGLTPADTRSFRSDSLWNYELGTKNTWGGDRFMLNADVYYIRWNDIQQTVSLPCGYAFTANAGAAKSEGTELEGRAHPLKGLELSVGVGYEHAVIAEKATGIGALSPQLPGSPIYLVPDWTANAEATYSEAITSGYSLIYHAGYSYVGNQRSGNVNPFEPRLVPAYGLVEANVGFNWSRYEVLLVGKNLTNTIASYGDYIAISAELPGRPRVAIAPPRTIGLEFRATF